MASVRLSAGAKADLKGIARYTLRVWGEAQTLRYIAAIRSHCHELAEGRALGRPCQHIRPGLRRSESGKHVVFYRQDDSGIVVSRILHERMSPELHDLHE